MNIFILLLGLILIVISTIMIFTNNKRNIIGSEEIEMTNYISKVKSESVEYSNEFENVLNGVNHKLERELYDDVDFSLSDKELIVGNDNDKFQDNEKYIYESQEELKDNDPIKIYNKIIELRRSGLGVEEIAKITEKGIREVEIILKFHNKKSN